MITLFVFILVIVTGFIWFAVLAYQLLKLQDTFSVEQELTFFEITAKEIFMQQKLQESRLPYYDFEGRSTGTLPQLWQEDLLQRQN